MPALVHASTPAARRLPLGNLLVRAVGVVVFLPWLPEAARLLREVTRLDHRLVVDFHLAFNFLLAIALMPAVTQLARLLIRWLPDPPQPADPGRPLYLEASAVDSATVALANGARETLRMADMAERMLRNALELFRTADRDRVAQISTADRAIRQLGSAIRAYLVAIASAQTLDDTREGARLQEILSAVINVEHVGDIVANSLMDFAVTQFKRGQTLSVQELETIAAMHAELLESLNLAMAVFLHGDSADARRLVGRKQRLLEMEGAATTLSVELLREPALTTRFAGNEAAAAEQSGMLLRIVRDLRRVHSHLASFAYPVTHRGRLRPRRRARAAPATAPAGEDASGDQG
jgi:phosphate:Na+ symporter